jgi:hypothetical protein
MKTRFIIQIALFGSFMFYGCKEDEMPMPVPLEPNTAPHVVIDRFSNDAGTLFIRDGSNNLPGPNIAINFDQATYITKGFNVNGDIVKYYNFDVQPSHPGPIFVLFMEGESDPVPNQLNIIDVVPRDEGYNDFWHVPRVTVPADYVANSVTSLQGIMDKYFSTERTNMIVNYPIVDMN